MSSNTPRYENIDSFDEGFDPRRNYVRNKLYGMYRAEKDSEIYYPQLNKMDDEELLYRFNNFGRSKEEQKESEELYYLMRDVAYPADSGGFGGGGGESYGINTGMDFPAVYPGENPLFKTRDVTRTQPKIGITPAQQYLAVEPNLPWWLRSYGLSPEGIVSQQAVAEIDLMEEEEEDTIKQRYAVYRVWQNKAMARKTIGYGFGGMLPYNPQDFKPLLAQMAIASQTDELDPSQDIILAEVEEHSDLYDRMSEEINNLIVENPDTEPIAIVGSVLKKFANEDRDRYVTGAELMDMTEEEIAAVGSQRPLVFPKVAPWVTQDKRSYLFTAMTEFSKKLEAKAEQLSAAAAENTREDPNTNSLVEEVKAEALMCVTETCKELEGKAADFIDDLRESGSYSEEELRVIASGMVGAEVTPTEKGKEKDMIPILESYARDNSAITEDDNILTMALKMKNMGDIFNYLIKQSKEGIDIQADYAETLRILKENGVLLPFDPQVSPTEILERSQRLFHNNVIIPFTERRNAFSTPEGRYQLAAVNVFRRFVDPSISDYSDVLRYVQSAVYDTDPNMTLNRKMAIIELYSNGRSAFKASLNASNGSSALNSALSAINAPPGVNARKPSQTPFAFTDFPPSTARQDPQTWNESVQNTYQRWVETISARSYGHIKDPKERANMVSGLKSVMRIEQNEQGLGRIVVDWESSDPSTLIPIAQTLLDEMDQYNVSEVPSILRGLGMQVTEGLQLMGGEIGENETEKMKKVYRSLSILGMIYNPKNATKAKGVKSMMGWNQGDYSAYQTAITALRADSSVFSNLGNFYEAASDKERAGFLSEFARDFNTRSRVIFEALANRASGSAIGLSDTRRGLLTNTIQTNNFLSSVFPLMSFGKSRHGQRTLQDMGEKSSGTSYDAFNAEVEVGDVKVSGWDKIRATLQEVMPGTQFKTFESSDFTNLANELGGILGLNKADMKTLRERVIEDGEDWIPWNDSVEKGKQEEVISYLLIRELLNNNQIANQMHTYVQNRHIYSSEVPVNAEEFMSVIGYFYKNSGVNLSGAISLTDTAGVFSYSSPTLDKDFVHMLGEQDVLDGNLDGTYETAMSEALALIPFKKSPQMTTHLKSTYMVAEGTEANELKVEIAKGLGLTIDQYNSLVEETIDALDEVYVPKRTASSPTAGSLSRSFLQSKLDGGATRIQTEGASLVSTHLKIIELILRQAEDMDGDDKVLNFSGLTLDMLKRKEEFRTIGGLLTSTSLSYPDLTPRLLSPTPQTMSIRTDAGRKHLLVFDIAGLKSSDEASIEVGGVAPRRVSLPFITFRGANHK